MILNDIKELIKGIGPVVVKLAQFDFGIPGPGSSGTDNHKAPAIFTSAPAPADCPGPLITLTLNSADDFGTRGQRGAQYDITVNLWGDRLMTEAPLRKLAFDLWDGLNRAELAITHYRRVCIDAHAPVKITDNEGFPGYVIVLGVPVMEV